MATGERDQAGIQNQLEPVGFPMFLRTILCGLSGMLRAGQKTSLLQLDGGAQGTEF